MKPRRHKYLRGMSLSSCFMCDGDGPPADCWSGEDSGYVSCEDCYKSKGPNDRNCLPAIASEYLKLVDAAGRGPVFAVSGDLRITGRVMNVRTKKPIHGLPVRLVFPNGLCLTTRTNNKGRFVLKLESYERRRQETINIGMVFFRKTGNRSFNMGFTLNHSG